MLKIVFHAFEFMLIQWESRRLITNSSDRTLRQFNLPIYPPCEEGEVMEQELEPTLRFSDPIGRVAWHNMAYSPDGEWLAGGVYYQYCKFCLMLKPIS